MEQRPGRARRITASVEVVADDGMSDRCEVNADLMSHPRFDHHLQ